MTRPTLRPLAVAIAAALLVVACAGDPAPTAHPARVFTFDDAAPGSLPTGLAVGGTTDGGPPHWQVVTDANAPSGGQALEQSDPSGDDPRYCVLLADAPVARDVRISVACQPLTGRLDRSAGLVFRAVDDLNYYVVRANLLEKDIRLYRCVDGIRTDIAAWERRLAGGRWHTLEAEMRGDAITVRWDGDVVIEATDATYTAAGRAGLWTKADSVTRFDDLRIEALK